MGNMVNKQPSIFEAMDNISSNYILSMDYHALSRMGDEPYCNKFTLITQDILDKQFNKLDIQYLSIRIKKGHKPLIDIFNRNIEYKKIDIDETFPQYILDNIDKFKKWII